MMLGEQPLVTRGGCLGPGQEAGQGPLAHGQLDRRARRRLDIDH